MRACMQLLRLLKEETTTRRAQMVAVLLQYSAALLPPHMYACGASGRAAVISSRAKNKRSHRKCPRGEGVENRPGLMTTHC
mmetsp:Transcript_59733/g.171332  ORF Transcript_59733/g.171332 Transcript_59733/m.171332 type:complete len:81 (+) Transcript_59733:24-266(+)